MSKYLLFSRAATDKSFLKLVGEKSAPSRVDPADVSDSESDSDAEDFEERKDKETIAPKTKIASRPRRKNCKELVDLIHEHEPGLSDCKSDKNCLYLYTEQNLLLLHKHAGDGMEIFREELDLLRKLIIAMYQSSTSTLSSAFVEFTAARE